MTAGHVEYCAEICHEANRVYCRSLGDFSQVPWAEAPEWQRESVRNGVRFHVEHPSAGPSASHDNWMREKITAGWSYGLAKDEKQKLHPCCVPFEELPLEQQLKDHIFTAIVHAYFQL